MRTLALTALWLGLACVAGAQELVCVQQPASGLYYRTWQDTEAQASLWVCTVRGGSATIPDVHHAMRYLGPFSAQSIITWGEWTNRVSWKGRLGTVFEAGAFAAPLVNLAEIKEAKWRGLLSGLPIAIGKGGEYLKGQPKDFQVATADPPFFAIYTQASDQIAFEAHMGPPNPPPLPTVAPPAVEPVYDVASIPALWQPAPIAPPDMTFAEYRVLGYR